MTHTKRKLKPYVIFDGVWTYALLIFLALVWIVPIVWVCLASLRSDSTGLIYPTFFPKELSFANYTRLFEQTRILQFKKWVSNTFILAVCNCLGTTLITLATAYSLSRFRFKMRKPFMNIALILGMFPGFMAMTAVFLILSMVTNNEGQAILLGNYWALLIVYMSGAGLGFFVSKGYFDTLSVSLDESAYIEGASRFKVFYKIILPLAKPIIVYTALMAFMTPWADYVLARLLLGGDKTGESWTVAVGLYSLTESTMIADYFTTFAAGCVLIAAPIVMLYLSLQRFMVEGIASGAVKG